MRIALAGLGIVAGLTFCATAGAAGASSPKALTILAEVKAASGGAAWDNVTGWHEKGVHGTTIYETLLDYRRYGSLFKQIRGGQTSLRGFDGTVAWDRSPDGKVVVSTEQARLADARMTAYASINGFLFPDRFPARFEYLRAAEEKHHCYDVLRITPEDANPFEIWVDQRTHLMAKLVDRTGKRPVVATITGYEDVDGLKLGAGFTVSDGIPAHVEKVKISSYQIAPVSRALFDPPLATSDGIGTR